MGNMAYHKLWMVEVVQDHMILAAKDFFYLEYINI